jgi:ribosomal protein L3
MKRGAMTHGSKSHREHGSTGPGTTPGRTFPGLKMSGHMGAVRRKCRSLQVSRRQPTGTSSSAAQQLSTSTSRMWQGMQGFLLRHWVLCAALVLSSSPCLSVYILHQQVHEQSWSRHI